MNLNKKITAYALVLLLLVSACLVLPYGALSANAQSPRPTLIPGGMPFGVKLMIEGAMVVGVSDVNTPLGMRSPARDAGVAVGDVLLRANGISIDSVEQLSSIIDQSGGADVTLDLVRNGKPLSVVVTPVKTVEGSYRTGIWVKDSTAGIGTITYINPQNDTFGGLGHGICDGETGRLLPLKSGVVVDVNINGVVKGRANEPGELKGVFSSVKRGTLFANTECGVFGTINTSGMALESALEIGYRSEVKPGRASIIACAGGRAELYEAQIERITDRDGKTKNFIIRVTDDRLIEATGGIVQGMSGSPIIQNGRLIGAVTHVMINDPLRGYGIFIENMLDAAAKEGIAGICDALLLACQHFGSTRL